MAERSASVEYEGANLGALELREHRARVALDAVAGRDAVADGYLRLGVARVPSREQTVRLHRLHFEVHAGLESNLEGGRARLKLNDQGRIKIKEIK